MVIVNADDFGKGNAQNRGVALSFERGYCSSATIMPVTPFFLEACQYAREKHFIEFLGLHLCFFEGFALSASLKRQKRFCDDQGKLIFNNQNVLTPLTYQEKCACADEVRAQIARCRSEGIPLTHIDSHYHLHYIWNIASAVIAVARQEHIPFIRIRQNVPEASRLKQRWYTSIFNARLRVLGMAGTRYAMPIEAFLQIKDPRVLARLKTSCAINIHPYINEKGILANIYYNVDHDCAEQMRAFGDTSNIVSYSGKRYRRE